MPSAALMEWQTARSARLDELLAAHASMGGGRAGRRWRTQQINWSLTLRLAGEFQGFSRHLHDLTIEELANGIQSPHLGNIFAVMCTQNRELDRGNAHPGNINKDFLRLGLDLTAAIKQLSPNKGPTWIRSLNKLNETRNAIAHSNDSAISQLATQGYNPDLILTWRSWRRNCEGLAIAMDQVTSSYISAILNGPRPW